MTLAGRSLITIDDFSIGEVEAVFALADRMAQSVTAHSDVCRGKIMASLFFEPSTRTRLSFETAMHRLGGNVISAVDIGATSLAKGESIADMARVLGSYADIIVIRHPWEGAAKVVADYSGIPVINAGDGGHQHPTQTLLDLYTIKRERHTIRGLNVALWGDLKYGRTTHSLILALAKFGANILFCPSPGLEVPAHIVKKLIHEYGGELERFDPPARQSAKGKLLQLDTIYVTPSSPHQLAMMPGVDIEVEMAKGVDFLYVTRSQKERFTRDEEETSSQRHLPVVDKQMLKDRSFRKTLVMHPLPRVDELAYDLDADPRSRYFEQAALGVPVRMSLVALLLGSTQEPTFDDSSFRSVEYPVYDRESGIRCPNPRCVSVQDTETKYLKPAFKLVDHDPLTLRCVYCEHGIEPKYVASSQWHQGKLENRRYHIASPGWTGRIRPENLLIFGNEKQAEAQGYRPDSFLTGENRT